MMNRLSLAALLVAATATVASAQQTQTYTVEVPLSIQLTAPAAASLTHDETDNEQPFPAQTWNVAANSLNGVTVTFATDQPFTHTVDGSFQRDARLEVAVGTTAGPATWTPTAADQTDFVANDDVAQVQVSSDGVGTADLDLTVTFVTDQFGVFAAGDYLTTVTGTVTEN